MSLLRVGPEGLLLVWAVIVSVVVALLSWRKVGLTAAAVATLATALAIAAWQTYAVEVRPGHQLLVASFVIVPSALLLGASRLSWLARRAWVLLILGPILFAGSYVGVCVCASYIFNVLT
jgi:uncharacterized membrane protein YgdD (TMEM256/DUF423 family)